MKPIGAWPCHGASCDVRQRTDRSSQRRPCSQAMPTPITTEQFRAALTNGTPMTWLLWLGLSLCGLALAAAGSAALGATRWAGHMATLARRLEGARNDGAVNPPHPSQPTHYHARTRRPARARATLRPGCIDRRTSHHRCGFDQARRPIQHERHRRAVEALHIATTGYHAAAGLRLGRARNDVSWPARSCA